MFTEVNESFQMLDDDFYLTDHSISFLSDYNWKLKCVQQNIQLERKQRREIGKERELSTSRLLSSAGKCR